MPHHFETCDFDELAEHWNSFYPPTYRVDGALIRQNTIDCPVFDWGASKVVRDGDNVIGFAIVKKSPSPKLWKGSDSDQFHLSAIAFKDADVGVDILSDVKKLLRHRGASHLVFGQDARHFFPGCPVEFSSLKDFLTIEGFEPGGDAFDVERDLSDYVNPAPLKRSGELRPIKVEELRDLEAFFEREFPGRWKQNTMEKVAADGPDSVVALFVAGKIEGFALIQKWEDSLAIGGAVWRIDLGERWSALGPIGVSRRLRGEGYGGALLGAALQRLHELGAGRCIIDWTGLVDFYGKHGFRTSRTYRSFKLNLEAD